MLSDNTKRTAILGYSAAGASKKTSSILNMDGWDGVIFTAILGTTIEAGTIDVFVEQNTANATSGMARLATTTAYTVPATPAALTTIEVDIYKPREQYLQCNITPASQNAVILGILATQYRGHLCPATQDASVVKVTKLISPAEA